MFSESQYRVTTEAILGIIVMHLLSIHASRGATLTPSDIRYRYESVWRPEGRMC
jgi:hypothetical protein